jgi:hypothetical protein
MQTAYCLVAFASRPPTGILGFLIFRYPLAWAKINACLSQELHEFDSPKQLASSRRLGILMLIFAAFSFSSLLAMNVLVPLK